VYYKAFLLCFTNQMHPPSVKTLFQTIKSKERMKITFLTCLLALGLLVQKNTAQTITGKVVDSAQKPLDGALISLLKAQDSSLVKTTLTEADGSFDFINVKDNTYLVSVNLL
jgi:hypothetical protein